MSFKNDLYREIEREKRLVQEAEAKAAAKVRALKEELPTAQEMRTWHDGCNPGDRRNETPHDV